MLLLALSCRHASPPDQPMAAPHDPPVVVCDSGSLSFRLQQRLGPQRCDSDSDCTLHELSELAPMMPAEARERLGDVDVEPDPRVYSTSLLLGPDTTVESLVGPAAELTRNCVPRDRFRPEWMELTDGTVLFRSRPPAESAHFVGPDGVVREQCVAEVRTPACADSVCAWRPETRVVPCSQVSARSSM